DEVEADVVGERAAKADRTAEEVPLVGAEKLPDAVERQRAGDQARTDTGEGPHEVSGVDVDEDVDDDPDRDEDARHPARRSVAESPPHPGILNIEPGFANPAAAAV